MAEASKKESTVKSSDAYGMIAGKAVNTKQTTKRLIRYMKRQKNKLIIIFIFILISSVLNIAAPLLTGRVIDQLYSLLKRKNIMDEVSGTGMQQIGKILIMLISLYLVSGLFKYILEYIKASVAQKLTLSMRMDLNEKFNKLPLRYYDAHKKGEILSRVTNDIEKIVNIFEQSVVPLVTAVITLIGAVLFMLYISPVLTLLAFAAIIFSMFVTSRISQRSYDIFINNQETISDLNGHIQEVYHGREIIKAFHKEEDVTKKITDLCENQYNASRKAQFISYIIKPTVKVVNQLGYVAVAVLGGIFVIQGRISLGLLQAFIQYMNQSAEPITEAAYTINMIQAAVASAERIFEVLDEQEEPVEEIKGTAIQNPQGHVAFEHVKFGYSEDHILMEDINFSIKAGAKVAIVGPTGGGKTTLVNLLMRFYDLKGGKITIDGTDITKLRRGELRTMFGMVLQDTWLFQGTIGENIAYSVNSAIPDQITKAAKIARADYFIRTMPEGYQTIVNEDTSNLSQGQIQLITIARAVLADPAVLILDEATSSVDTRTEREIQKAMNNLMKGRTSFVIAHRLSTIKDSDLILVMDQGTIIEQGTHEELIQQNGFYNRLYNSQFANEA